MIAMGYPAQGSIVERLSRNHIEEVVRFVHLKHHNKVLIMNLVLYSFCYVGYSRHREIQATLRYATVGTERYKLL
jgi:hypothetical protein